MAENERVFKLLGQRIFIAGLMEPNRYSRMPRIRMVTCLIKGSLGYDMRCRGKHDEYIYQIDHLTIDDRDIINGFAYFARNEISMDLDSECCALMQRAIDILRKNRHDNHDRKEKMYNKNVYDLIEAADRCRKEIVLCLLGKPGIGKTEAVERFAKDHNRNVVHIITSQILPSEVSGMTMPNQETRSMDVFDHYRLSHMKDGDILFFDELLKGQQQVLNACLTLIQERRLMSGTELPDVLIIAAANPLASPTQLPLEIRQRFMFVEVDWDKDEWIKYMMDLGFENEHMLDELGDKIYAGLESVKTWNTLTPRTATKLCMWMRESRSPQVEWYIRNVFGADVASMISDVVENKIRESPKVQIANKIIENLTKKHIDPDEKDEDDSRSAAIDMAKDIASGSSDDMSALVDILIKLPEWDEIKEVLSNTKIEEEIKF